MAKTTSRIRDIDNIKPILDYLEKRIEKGYKARDLKWALINQGYSKIQVEKAIAIIDKRNEDEEKRKLALESKKAIENHFEEMQGKVEEKRGFFSSLKSFFSN